MIEKLNDLVLTEKMKEVNVTTDRIKRCRKRWQEADAIVCPEASILFTESWKETEGEPLDIRWAKAFANRVIKAEPVVREDELIVGSLTKYVKGVEVVAAYKADRVLAMAEKGEFESRLSDTAKSIISDEDLELLKADAEYWTKHVPDDYITKAVVDALGEDHLNLLADRAMVYEDYFAMANVDRSIFYGYGGNWLGQPAPNARTINRGLRDVINEAKGELEKTENTPLNQDKINLLNSVIISCEAVITWAHNHADLAEKLAKEEKNEKRKAELLTIAENCRVVPEFKPQSYWQAVQSLRFIHLALKKEQPDRPSVVIGRLDQILYPYFEADYNAGKITIQEATEILASFWIKTREMEVLETVTAKMRIAAGSMLQNVTLGGMDPDGNDLINPVSWIALKVMAELHLSEPAVYVRCTSKTSDLFLRYAMECNVIFGGGNPAFLNDSQGTDRWLDQGVNPIDACDWQATGCLAYRLVSADTAMNVHINQAKVFEIMMNDGFDPNTKKQLGPHTGDISTFTCIEDYEKAFFAQEQYFVDELIKDLAVRIKADLDHSPNSGLSAALMEGSIEKGISPLKGGNKTPEGNTIWMSDRGMVDVADCLSAIKYLVFDEKKITASELKDACLANWEGAENIHQMCLKAPKYGNDDAYIDSIYRYMTEETQKIMQSRPCPITGRKPQLFKGAASGHLIHGLVVGALPNGRMNHMPINDAGTSAMPGMDCNGPTANIISATNMDFTDFMGIAHNMKLPKELMNTDEKLDKAVALVKAFHKKGGWHVQFNIHDADELQDAKIHPKDHQNLIVRVGGYSAYFIDLGPVLQDEIIHRTLHQI